MHIAVLGNPGSWYCKDLERAAAERGHRFSRIEYPRLVSRVGQQRTTVSADNSDLTQLDALIVRSMPPGSLEQVVFRMDALARLEAAGVVVLNSPKSLECAIDKFLTTARLNAAGLQVPETVVCENSETAMNAFETLGGDVVIKPIFGSEGRGILRVSDADLALRAFRTLERIQAVLYVQKYVDHEGFDIRALVLDGRIIGGMRRTCVDDFRTNVAQNGRADPYSLSDSEVDWALRAAKAIGTRFAGVDLLYDRRGDRYVIEVNAVPGWRAVQQVTGCDVATFVVESLERNR